MYRIRSRRLNGAQAICYQVTYVPKALLGDVGAEVLEQRSLYGRLEQMLGDTLEQAKEAVDVVVADRYRAQQLGVKIKTPLLLIERVVYSRTGVAAEYSRSFYNPRMVSLTFLSTRRAETGHGKRLLLRRDETGHAPFARSASGLVVRSTKAPGRRVVAKRQASRNDHE